MDFLDPNYERRSQFRLLLGYCLVTLAIAATVWLLINQAYGLGLNRRGQVTQNGLLFVSSQPSGAVIDLNGAPYKSDTNTRVFAQSGSYIMKISRPGYRDWTRPIYVAG